MTRLVSGSNSELSRNCAMCMTRAAIGNGIMQIPRVILVALHWGHNSGDASAMCRSAWARRSRGHLGLAHPGFLGKPFMLGPTNRAVNAREKDRGGVEAFATVTMPVGIWCPVSGHLTMTTPIELSLFVLTPYAT